MRLIYAIKADMLFQMQQGFYFVYAVITVVYIVILSLLPLDVADITLPLVVFSDPSVLGMFFIGGIIMLEKTQGVLMVLVVSPLRIQEYILAKVISLAAISVLVAFAITGFGSAGSVNWFLLFVSTSLASAIFTMVGIMINAGCNTVNQYLLKTVPWMLLIILPCFSLLGFPYSWLFQIVPSVAALRLMLGAYTGIDWLEAVGLVIILLAANYLLLRMTIKIFENKIVYQD
jgi:fluoroquinolone transport system permease protein